MIDTRSMMGTVIMELRLRQGNLGGQTCLFIETRKSQGTDLSFHRDKEISRDRLVYS